MGADISQGQARFKSGTDTQTDRDPPTHLLRRREPHARKVLKEGRVVHVLHHQPRQAAAEGHGWALAIAAALLGYGGGRYLGLLASEQPACGRLWLVIESVPIEWCNRSIETRRVASRKAASHNTMYVEAPARSLQRVVSEEQAPARALPPSDAAAITSIDAPAPYGYACMGCGRPRIGRLFSPPELGSDCESSVD